MCGVITSVDQCAIRARSTHGVHHAIVEVNIVIGVVLGELHVVVRVHIPLVVVCDDAVVRRTLVLIAFAVGFVFVVAIFHRILLYWRYTVYKLARCARLNQLCSHTKHRSQSVASFTSHRFCTDITRIHSLD